MKIGIFLTNHTKRTLLWLESQRSNTPELSVFLSEEEAKDSKTDIMIADASATHLIKLLSSLPNPPLIVIPDANGRSSESIRYLPDFTRQFPLLLAELPANNPTLCLSLGEQKYMYYQKDIILIGEDIYPTIALRSGRRVLADQKLSKIAKQLSARYFFKLSSKLFINIEYVSEFNGSEVILQNGWRFTIPQENKNKVENAIFKTKYYKNQAVSTSETEKNKKIEKN